MNDIKKIAKIRTTFDNIYQAVNNTDYSNIRNISKDVPRSRVIIDWLLQNKILIKQDKYWIWNHEIILTEDMVTSCLEHYKSIPKPVKKPMLPIEPVKQPKSREFSFLWGLLKIKF